MIIYIYIYISTRVNNFISSSNLLNAKMSVLERLNIFSSVVENCRMVLSKPDCKSDILIWDTGALFGMNLFKSDFIDCVHADIPLREITKVNQVIGIVTTTHKYVDVNGTTCYLPCVSYHIPSINVQIYSLQTYHQMHGGYSTVYGHHVMIHLKDHNINSNLRT